MHNKLVKVLAIFILAVAVTFCGGRYAIADEPQPDASIICDRPPHPATIQ